MSIQRLKGYIASGVEPPADPGGRSYEEIRDKLFTDEEFGSGPSPWDDLAVHGNPRKPELGKDGDASA